MGHPIYVVDAFTNVPFAGNPAGVCFLESEQPAEWMQNVAAEMRHAETAFLVPQANGWHLRWFTPEIEVDLCGHATLASAHVLWETGRLGEGWPAIFYTLRQGVLTCERTGEQIAMDFPALAVESTAPVPGLLESLGVHPTFVGSSGMDYLVEVDSEETVRGLTPDMALLRTVPTRGIIVTARSSEFDFVSRFFAPAAGVPEDPVTGSAHCALGPYWAAKLGQALVQGYQASERGGKVAVEVHGDRVRIFGNAVTVLEGVLQC